MMFKTNEIFHKIDSNLCENLPQKFTYPFNYQPHELVKLAAEEVQFYLNNQSDFLYNFGHDAHSVGKMFGILLVKNLNGEIGYLAAFSGKINEKNQLAGFVPPVYDVLQADGIFKIGEQELNAINTEIDALENDPEFKDLILQKEHIASERNLHLEILKSIHKSAKRHRKKEREKLEILCESERLDLIKNLENQSKKNHFQWKDAKRLWQMKMDNIDDALSNFQQKINSLKVERKIKSAELQQELHEGFIFLNAKNQRNSLLTIFSKYDKIPPAGAGECAAPRLLQCAFQNGLKPIVMGEFWYGKSPNSQIRKHGNFYPACKSKCEPILKFMLQGLKVEKNPMSTQKADFDLEILYEDDWLIAVNKPEGILSVPGKKLKKSMLTKIQAFLNSPEVYLAHRLDMATSGILLAAKNLEIYKLIQAQFTERKVKKTYTAILDGKIQTKSGKIDLPIRVDLDNRPMQLVDLEHGKHAKTYYQVVNVAHNQTRILFYPYTGRTHQLRVHAAHQLGLGTPILGDDLYGQKRHRLYLHANHLEFTHPVTLQKMKINAMVPF